MVPIEKIRLAPHRLPRDGLDHGHLADRPVLRDHPQVHRQGRPTRRTGSVLCTAGSTSSICCSPPTSPVKVRWPIAKKTIGVLLAGTIPLWESSSSRCRPARSKSGSTSANPAAPAPPAATPARGGGYGVLSAGSTGRAAAAALRNEHQVISEAALPNGSRDRPGHSPRTTTAGSGDQRTPRRTPRRAASSGTSPNWASSSR